MKIKESKSKSKLPELHENLPLVGSSNVMLDLYRLLAKIMNLDDPVEGEIVLSGEANENGTLMADTSQITDEDGVASLSVQWESSKDGRSWSIMENIQGISLNLGQYLVGSQIRARLSVVDNFGTETILVSQPSRTIENVNNKPSGSIIIRRVNVSG